MTDAEEIRQNILFMEMTSEQTIAFTIRQPEETLLVAYNASGRKETLLLPDDRTWTLYIDDLHAGTGQSVRFIRTWNCRRLAVWFLGLMSCLVDVTGFVFGVHNLLAPVQTKVSGEHIAESEQARRKYGMRHNRTIQN